MSCDHCKGKNYPPGPHPYIKCAFCGRELSERPTGQIEANNAKSEARTAAQNRALHKWANELATELNDRGLDMRTFLKPGIEIPWDGKLIKQHILHPIIEAMLQKGGTSELTTAEVSKVVDVINRHLLQKYDFNMPFPSEENRHLGDGV